MFVLSHPITGIGTIVLTPVIGGIESAHGLGLSA
jgi:hypothetical protein